jgi:thiaminase
VDALAAQADHALASATEEQLSEARSLVTQVCELEIGFWQTAFSRSDG